MITLMPKRQLGVRVTVQTADKLKRWAAKLNCSVNELTERILVGHIEALERGQTADFDQFMHVVDEALAHQSQHYETMIKAFTDRTIKNLNSLKAMIDASVATHCPEVYAEYSRRTTELLKAMELPH